MVVLICNVGDAGNGRLLELDCAYSDACCNSSLSGVYPMFPSRREPMTFVRQASAAVTLITLSLWLQSGGMAALIRWARTSLGPDTHKLGPLRSAVLMVRFTAAIIALHVLQILLWASFYHWLCLPLWESAFYFSTASYTTVGPSNVVLPQMWRILGPVERLVGVLMCGLSASFLFTMVTRLVEGEARFSCRFANLRTELRLAAKDS
jgi:hypothetical protein